MSDNDIVILSAVRTAQGRFQGGFAGTPAPELGALAMTEALKRAGVTGDQLDEVIFGNVIQAGLGQNVARQAELKAGIPDSVPAITVNRVCVSSASALAMAAAAIKAGDGDVYLVGGTENMTRAPWVLQNGRSGYRMGMPTDNMYDAMVWDGLWDAANNYHMGVTAENLSERSTSARKRRTRSPTRASCAPRPPSSPVGSRTRSSPSSSRSARATPRSWTRTSARARPRLRSSPASSRSSRRTAAW